MPGLYAFEGTFSFDGTRKNRLCENLSSKSPFDFRFVPPALAHAFNALYSDSVADRRPRDTPKTQPGRRRARLISITKYHNVLVCVKLGSIKGAVIESNRFGQRDAIVTVHRSPFAGAESEIRTSLLGLGLDCSLLWRTVEG
jgi:hypothetical protein